MSKKQLLLFSLVTFLIFGTGSGFVTLIPVHLSRLGATPQVIGSLFSVLYVGMASASILAGWLADRFGRHKRMCSLSTAVGILASALMLVGARSFPLLSVGLFLGWFTAGIHAALVSTLVGLHAHAAERGRVFGIQGVITGLGPVLSGFLFGWIIDRYGFETLLGLNLAISCLLLVLTFFYQEPPKRDPLHQPEPRPGRTPLPVSFYLIASAGVLAWIAINSGKLGISLVMARLDYSANQISLTAGIASLAALALPLLLGWLSDSIGRKPLLLGLNLLGVAGLWIISREAGFAGFCVASALLSFYSCYNGLANALITDLLPPEALGIGISLISSTAFIAGIFSSALTGWAMDTLGQTTPFLAALLLPLAAVLLLLRVRETKKRLAVSVPDLPA